MATVDNANTGAPAEPNVYQEAEKLLKIAEQWEEKCETRERRLELVRLLAIMATFTLIIAGFGLYYGIKNEDWEYRAVVIAVVAVNMSGMAYYWLYIWGKSRRLLERDQRALYEIVDMLREVEKGIAERYQLSSLERAEFRIRLSRFDIGPGRIRPKKPTVADYWHWWWNGADTGKPNETGDGVIWVIMPVFFALIGLLIWSIGTIWNVEWRPESWGTFVAAWLGLPVGAGIAGGLVSLVFFVIVMTWRKLFGLGVPGQRKKPSSVSCI
jgi:hypothetical protein